MNIYKLNGEIVGLVPAGFLEENNAKSRGVLPKDYIRVDGVDPAGAWGVGVWGVEKGEFEMFFSFSEFVTILEGRVIITHEGESHNLGPGDSFFTPKGATVHWKVLEDLRKSYLTIS
ncbi:MAG: cupin domain-containing protein [Rhizobium sp.]|nr:cupin domain-containing protein [Rhizobium sp.]MCZ8352773.1 cupin domain-containing protein [Rhizobium sp.]